MVNELGYFSADCTALPSVIETTFPQNDGKLACFSFIDINAHKTTTAGEANIESKARLSGKQLQTTNLQLCPPQSWGSTISSVSFPFDTLLCYISRRREAVVLLCFSSA